MSEINPFCAMHMKHHFLLAFFIRIALLLYGYFQDAFFEVKYTDIDYQVFTDAGKYVSAGLSPYQRPTYRYTPLLAYMMVPNIKCCDAFGKLLFCVWDILTAVLIFGIQKNYGYTLNMCRLSAFIWLYNPLCIVISTRGNAESLMTFLIMLSVFCYQTNRPLLLGLVYGLAIHVKIYPCVYALSFYFAFSDTTQFISRWGKFKTLFYPNRKKITLVLSAMFGFGLPTLVSVVLYKDEYLEHALLYHLIRKDIRHNFSPYFYAMYLSESVDGVLSVILSASAFLLQGLLIALISWVLCMPKLLPACMFVETFIFVTFNKVCTSQYFLWYLCLFPLCYPLLNAYHKNIIVAFFVWLIGQGLWLLPAYYLEFGGENRFLLLYISSLLFFCINVSLICLFLKYVSLPSNLIVKKTKKA